VDVDRYARQIALPEVGPDGQARICAARVAVVGNDRTAETAALYLRASGVADLRSVATVTDWNELLSNVDLVVRTNFDDDAMLGVARRLGLPVIVVRAHRDAVDLLAFPRRPPAPDAPADVPSMAAAQTDDGPAAVLAGTLAAANALWLIVSSVEAATAAPPRPIRHVRVPLDGREPLVQEIPQP